MAATWVVPSLSVISLFAVVTVQDWTGGNSRCRVGMGSGQIYPLATAVHLRSGQAGRRVGRGLVVRADDAEPASGRSRVLKVLRFLRNWTLLSLPLGIAVGKFLKGRAREPHRGERG